MAGAFTAAQQAALRDLVQAAPPASYAAYLHAHAVEPFLEHITAQTEDVMNDSFQQWVRSYLFTRQPAAQERGQITDQLTHSAAAQMGAVRTQSQLMFGDSLQTTIEGTMAKYSTSQRQLHQCPKRCFTCDNNDARRVCTLNVPEGYQLAIPQLHVEGGTTAANAASVQTYQLNVHGQSSCAKLNVMSVEQLTEGGTSSICCQKGADKKNAAGAIAFTTPSKSSAKEV